MCVAHLDGLTTVQYYRKAIELKPDLILAWQASHVRHCRSLDPVNQLHTGYIATVREKWSMGCALGGTGTHHAHVCQQVWS